MGNKMLSTFVFSLETTRTYQVFWKTCLIFIDLTFLWNGTSLKYSFNCTESWSFLHLSNRQINLFQQKFGLIFIYIMEKLAFKVLLVWKLDILELWCIWNNEKCLKSNNYHLRQFLVCDLEMFEMTFNSEIDFRSKNGENALSERRLYKAAICLNFALCYLIHFFCQEYNW